MRRLFCLFVLAVLAVPASAGAAGWHHLTVKPFHLSLKYPAGWTATPVQPGANQIQIYHSGKPLYAMTIALLPFKAAGSPRALAAHFERFARAQGNVPASRLAWSATQVGGKPAVVGVLHTATEGGVSTATALYLVGWHARAYELTTADYAPGVKTAAAFPAVYRQILATIRFR